MAQMFQGILYGTKPHSFAEEVCARYKQFQNKEEDGFPSTESIKNNAVYKCELKVGDSKTLQLGNDTEVKNDFKVSVGNGMHYICILTNSDRYVFTCTQSNGKDTFATIHVVTNEDIDAVFAIPLRNEDSVVMLVNTTHNYDFYWLAPNDNFAYVLFENTTDIQIKANETAKAFHVPKYGHYKIQVERNGNARNIMVTLFKPEQQQTYEPGELGTSAHLPLQILGEHKRPSEELIFYDKIPQEMWQQGFGYKRYEKIGVFGESNQPIKISQRQDLKIRVAPSQRKTVCYKPDPEHYRSLQMLSGYHYLLFCGEREQWTLDGQMSDNGEITAEIQVIMGDLQSEYEIIVEDDQKFILVATPGHTYYLNLRRKGETKLDEKYDPAEYEIIAGDQCAIHFVPQTQATIAIKGDRKKDLPAKLLLSIGEAPTKQAKI